MAKPLPHQVYRIVEGKLHNEKALLDTIQNGRRGILADGPSHDNGVPSGHSKHADPTAVKGVLLSDGTREMQRAERWLRAIADTRSYFALLPEERVLNGFYGRNVGIKGFLQDCDISKSRFYDLRDNIVYHCAFQAASHGLIQFSRQDKELMIFGHDTVSERGHANSKKRRA